MAARFTTALQPSNTAPWGLLWQQFIRDVMVEGGWVQTADTGQTDWTTFGGYAMWAPTDPLQATAPIFVRMDFGASPCGFATSPYVGLSFGTGTDGAGTFGTDQPGPTQLLLGINGNVMGAGMNSVSTSIPNCYSYGCAGPGYFAFGLFQSESASGTTTLMFGVERTRDAVGAETGDGLVVIWKRCQSGQVRSTTVVRRGISFWDSGAIQDWLTAAPIGHAGDSEKTGASETHAVGLIWPVRDILPPPGNLLPVEGRVAQQDFLDPPLMNAVVMLTQDWGNFSAIEVTRFGRAVPYVRLRNEGVVPVNQFSNTRMFMRWE